MSDIKTILEKLDKNIKCYKSAYPSLNDGEVSAIDCDSFWKDNQLSRPCEKSEYHISVKEQVENWEEIRKYLKENKQ